MIKNTTAEGVFINLVRSVINNEKPSALPEGITADELYEIGYNQKMVSMVLCAINMIRPKPASDNWGKYLSLFSAGCINSEVQMDEYHKLVEYLCKNGVKIIPLKGCVINGLYPSVGLRAMSDVDLLYSGVDTKELSRLMEEFGYTTDHLDAGCHDNFSKEGNISIELHRKLMEDDSPYRSVLENMFDKAVADEKIPNLYHMKPEDLYIHVIVHAAKHMKGTGLGVRPFADIYLINREYKDKWDASYIDAQLKSVKLDKFEEKLRTIADAFFSDTLMEVQKEDMDFIFRAGLYGVHGDFAWRYLSDGYKTKVGIFFRQVFLPYSDMCRRFPILEKKPSLLPFMWIRRIFSLIFVKRDILKTGVKSINTVKSDDAEYATNVMASFGLGE